MTKLHLREGDLFSTHASALAHGVNVDGLMGAGIAVAFKHKFPDMYVAYKVFCEKKALTPGKTFVWDDDATGLTIYNIASQDRPGPNARLEWLEAGIDETLDHAAASGIPTVAMPRIGCGIGGLEWADVEDIMRHYAKRSPVDIEVWTL